MGFNPSIVQYLSAKKYDIFIVGNYSTPTGMLMTISLKARGIPFLLYADGAMAKNDCRLKFAVKKFFISKASAWISSSCVTDNYFMHYGADKNKIYRHPFSSVRSQYIESCPLGEAEKLSLRKQLGIAEEKVVISVGRFIHLKGYDVLIKACRGLGKNVGVYIIGGAPTDEYLALQKQCQVENIHYIEHLSAPELKKYYLASDLFVLPSRIEPWGLVVNEAMANGLPVITTDKCVAGLELVEDSGNGFIIPADDAVQLAEKMNTILGDDELRQKMARESIRKIQPYT
ncbi:MAG: glycosyltransferase family 4 protein, partial [Oscillospiraceae bacterium]|nr:glycosyltransferase family 4 protein [Oscillospiraceae bacterium]